MIYYILIFNYNQKNLEAINDYSYPICKTILKEAKNINLMKYYIFKQESIQNIRIRFDWSSIYNLLLRMGNKQSSNQKLLHLQAKCQKIIVHHNFQMTLNIYSVDTFPHGLDGLRLWEAGIILARYIIHNTHLFKQKRVLELGAGVGIAGFTAKKWTQCVEVDITDYPPKVIENIKRNMHKNQLSCPAYELDWTKHETNPIQYQVIMGSDIVYFGCPVQDLYQVFKQKLVEGGIGIIVIPVRKNYAELFMEHVQKSKFDVEIEKIDKQQYFESPMQNSGQGQKRFPLLNQIGFQVYKLIRKAI